MKNRIVALCALMALVVIGTAWRVSSSGADHGAGLGAPVGQRPASSHEEAVSAAPVPEVQDRMLLATAPEAGAAPPTVEAGPDAAGIPGRLRLRVSWRDGSPASGVALLLMSPNARRHRHGDRWDTTDEEGVVDYPMLAAGSYTVEADRGGKVKATVISGEQVTATLVLDGAYDVHGIVRDGEGRPVAGAEVVAVAWRYDWRGSKTVATSDASGGFVIRCIDDGRSLGAFASGWAPSKLFDLSTVDPGALGEDRVVEVELWLLERGADIWGTVTNPAGDPLEGVLVAAGASDAYQAMFSGGHFREKPKPRVAETDEEGRYRIDGVAPGLQPLAAWHRDWPIWSSEVEITAGAHLRRDIALTPGVTVYGVARLADGKPAPMATVLALPAPFVDPFPDQGPTDEGTPFPHPRTQADGDGRYELGPVAPGDLHLHASLGTSFLTRWSGSEPKYQGTLQESLWGAAGERVEWNPTLSFGFAVAGRAVYADGSPVWDAFVTAIDDQGEHFAATTREDGAFMIPGLKKVPHRVTFQMPFDAPKTASVRAYYDVVPPVQDLLFQLDYHPEPKLPTGKLRLRVDDEASIGVALGKGAVTPIVHYETSFSWRTMEPNKDGVFETHLPPGHYRIVLSVPSHIVRHVERIEIRSGETLDMGTVKTLPLGTLDVMLERPESLQGPVAVRPVYYDAPKVTVPAGEVLAHFDQLAPGMVRVELSGRGLVKETLETEILAGVKNTLRVPLRPAALIRIESTLAQSQGFRRLVLTVTDSDGKTWLERSRRELAISEWPFVTKIELGPGSYMVRIATSDGQSAERPLVIKTLEDHPPFSIKGR